jgi:cellulose biosynthesis protein BcsQ
MIDRRKRLHLEIAERLPTERDDVVTASIPALSLIERMSVERAPVAAFAPHSRAAQRYRELWADVRARAL